MQDGIARAELLRRAAVAGAGLLASQALPGCARDERKAGAAPPPDGTKPSRGGRIRLGVIDGDPDGGLDVHKPSGGASTIRGFALFSKLWEWSEEMTPRLALAESAEPNADASTWTIRLHKGLEFHNGKTITADDVIFSARRLSDPELASPNGALIHPLDRDRIEKLDDRTVRIHAKPGLGYLALPDTWVNFGGIVPADYHPVTNPVGAGPFRLKEFRPGRRTLLTRFENYYKSGLPYVDEVEIIDFRDQVSRLAALESGQIDFANAISTELKRLVTESARAQLVVSPTNGFSALNMNVAHEAFRDVRVRQAFRLLTDRAAMVARVYNGEGRIANDLYAPHDPTFNTAIPQRRFDVAEARSLLKSAGHEKLTVELVSTGTGVNEAVVFAEQAKLAGVEIRVRKVDAPTFNGSGKRSFALSTGGSLASSFLATGLRHDAPTAVANRTNFADPRFAELFLEALKTVNLEKRKLLVHEAQAIQHERGGLLIWGFYNALDAVSDRVGGVVPEHSHFPTWRFEKLWARQARV